MFFGGIGVESNVESDIFKTDRRFPGQTQGALEVEIAFGLKRETSDKGKTSTR